MIKFSLPRGFTLIESLIALLLGSVSLMALVSLVSSSLAISNDIIQKSRLQEALGNIISRITEDVRRAGYAGNSLIVLSDPDVTSTVFNQAIELSEYPGEAVNSCILYSYDRNDNGILDTNSPSELFGFRLRDKSIEIRKNGAGCTASGWEDLTEASIVEVDQFSFSRQATVNNQITTQKIMLSVTGFLKSSYQYSVQAVTEVVPENVLY